jgi:hypothetical protein
MYTWQTVWCILSVDYNQYNYCKLRTVCSPIFHSVHKKRGPNSCVILFMGLHPPPYSKRAAFLTERACCGGTVADASLSLAATLVHTACVMLRLLRLVTVQNTAAIEERHKDARN